MPNIVVNKCYGGFGLSEAGVMRYAELKDIDIYPQYSRFGLPTNYYTKPLGEATVDDLFHVDEIPRHDPALVQVVEELGENANWSCSKLEIEVIPLGIPYRISEYDGMEEIYLFEDFWRDWSLPS